MSVNRLRRKKGESREFDADAAADVDVDAGRALL